MDFLDIILNLRNLSLLQLHNNVSPWPTYTKDVLMDIYISLLLYSTHCVRLRGWKSSVINFI